MKYHTVNVQSKYIFLTIEQTFRVLKNRFKKNI